MKHNEVKIRKIPVDELINVLQEAYSMGVDYVDINGILDNNQDAIEVIFTRDYMNKEYINNFPYLEEELPQKIETIKLSDDDLNQLI